ncbi:MAG: malonyl-CoA decarboxylase [Rhodospirillales bacterium]|nr:malonyl-CoA decarboxylase [Rhodospirillales bacterium]
MSTADRFFDRLLKFSWRDLLGAALGEDAQPLDPDLPEGDAERVRAQMQECLEAKGGEVSARSRAVVLGHAYLSLNDTGKRRFLAILAEKFDADPGAIASAIAALGRPKLDRRKAHRALRQALEAPRLHLLTQFNALPEGVKFLVDLRADLLRLAGKDGALLDLEADLKGLLAAWFDIGFLALERITWRSPAAILEKLIAYEAVHAIKGWGDLKNRLDSDRRLYAFFHPRMPEEPLIFVEVALVRGMASSIQALLDESAPLADPARADTAIFYSISNAQKGLAGISFGNYLIKRVVDALAGEFPKLETFATLSPIPGFRAWLEGKLGEGALHLLTKAEHKAITRHLGHGGGKGGLKALLARADWANDAEAVEVLKGPLQRLAARYLAAEKRADGRALDPVAHFHLSNGARIERLNWLADLSDKGMAQSMGLMVNYLYRLADIDANHEDYAAQGKVALAPAIKTVLRA